MLTRMLTASAAAVGLACLLAAPVSAEQAAPARAADKLPSNAIIQLVNDLLKAQSLSTGRGVTVAVISTGVDPKDPSLSGKVTTGPNYAFKPAVPLSQEYGTIVASIIAGSGPSGSQPLSAEGIAPDARILSIRAWPQSNEHGSSQYYQNADYLSLEAESINYAVSHGAQVIYIDEATQQPPNPDLWKAVSAAVAKKVVIVAAEQAFGTTPDSYSYPPGIPGVIGVGSIQLSGGQAPFDKTHSSRNNAIVVAGPGNAILGSGNWEIDGPGGATSIVAGSVALIKSLYPSLTDAQVEQALATSARYHPAGGYDTTIGFGLINPYGALVAADKLSKATAPGDQGVASGGHFGSGPLGTIKAVHHSKTKLTEYESAAGGGILVLLAALVLGLVWRRKARRLRRQAAPPAFGPVPQFQQPPAWPPPPASGG